MNKTLILGSTAIILTACGTSHEPKEPMVGMANPASVFCVKQGGKSVLKENPDGSQYGVCHLPDGSVVEEWEYFRQHNK